MEKKRKYNYKLIILVILALILIPSGLYYTYNYFNAKTSETQLSKSNDEKTIYSFNGTIVKPGNISLILTYDKIPLIEQKVDLDEILFNYTGNQEIIINGDNLETDYDNINIKLNEIIGTIKLNEDKLNFIGTVKKISIENVALNSKEIINIEINNLTYNNFIAKGLSLNVVKLNNGQGQMEIENNLNYNLQNSETMFNNYYGDITINEDKEIIFNGQITDLTLLEPEMIVKIN